MGLREPRWPRYAMRCARPYVCSAVTKLIKVLSRQNLLQAQLATLCTSIQHKPCVGIDTYDQHCAFALEKREEQPFTTASSVAMWQALVLIVQLCLLIPPTRATDSSLSVTSAYPDVRFPVPRLNAQGRYDSPYPHEQGCKDDEMLLGTFCKTLTRPTPHYYLVCGPAGLERRDAWKLRWRSLRQITGQCPRRFLCAGHGRGMRSMVAVRAGIDPQKRERIDCRRRTSMDTNQALQERARKRHKSTQAEHGDLIAGASTFEFPESVGSSGNDDVHVAVTPAPGFTLAWPPDDADDDFLLRWADDFLNDESGRF